MEIVVLTLFPQMFHGVIGESMLGRAQAEGRLQIRLVNFRGYAEDKHRTVDDYPFGGGAGMLLKPGPLVRAIESERSRLSPQLRTRTVLLTPWGRVFNQAIARELAQNDVLLLVCGHYEGFDERIRTVVDDELSLGDFVLTGGEIAAMAVIDAVARLIPGVLGNEASAEGDSFADGLLEYPQYTRPAEFRGMRVPEVLLSGHHERIRAWRHRHALYRTWRHRPDLLQRRSLTPEEEGWLARWQAGDVSDIDVPDA
ncbi:MAG: tRNA (guanosine(37)-N1)-methyltransferase TrmD [Thermoflavifilum sp.]|nr:tRNA (guanosine(37)-N1)-methyltransferase TrmD [Thermoflavifilum sp.]MCL6513349.1 tRNA (guanosine(37)-N1)-methyltransferase TrmD [Alicyclobacillus sp.]